MSNTYGENIKITIFGRSHSGEIGVMIKGLPADAEYDPEKLQGFLDRRAPGKDPLRSARREQDLVRFETGPQGGVITAVLPNEDARPEDYEKLKDTPRPGHGDYPARIKYGPDYDLSGGGHLSGRLTAPLCVAGGLCLQLLEREGIRIESAILSIGGRTDPALWDAAIAAAKAEGDSLGGLVECRAEGLPVGLGDPIFGRLEGRISSAVFAIPAIRGIEFGDGFAVADRKGSENNDAYRYEAGRVVTETNHAGGMLAGISNGQPLVFRVAVKPTPSIAKPQHTVNLKTGENTEISIAGRHDPCIVPRILPCIEAAAAIALYDAFLEQKKR